MNLIKSMLSKLTKKKYIYLVRRGNDALKQIVKLLPQKTYLIQDQGGWITYKQYPKKFKTVKTDFGIMSPKDLAQEEGIVLINSLPGYFAVQPMDEITKVCKKNNLTLINDISGSIGTKEATYGDIIFASCGKDKPINVGYGAFIASNNPLNINENFDNTYLQSFTEQLLNLKTRLKSLKAYSKNIKTDLNKYKILHKDHLGINVVIAYTDEKEKNEIIKYCQSNLLEYTLCPRYIRVNTNAISIEVKRR